MVNRGSLIHCNFQRIYCLKSLKRVSLIDSEMIENLKSLGTLLGGKKKTSFPDNNLKDYDEDHLMITGSLYSIRDAVKTWTKKKRK